MTRYTDEQLQTYYRLMGAIAIIAFVLLLLIVPFGPAFGLMEEEHEYEVKMEQVQDVNLLDENNVTPIDELGGDEQQALQQAYKQNDHFLGGASITIWTEEQLDLGDGFHLVGVEGVALLTSYEYDGLSKSFTGIGLAIMFCLILLGVPATIEAVIRDGYPLFEFLIPRR